MVSVESYKHKAAKSVVADWLREVEYDSYTDQDREYIRENGEHPMLPSYDVYEEYPICVNSDSATKVDARLIGMGISWNGPLSRHMLTRGDTRIAWWERLGVPEGNEPPSYEQCIALGLIPRIIFDVVLLKEYNWATTTDFVAIEVTHKHPVNDKKRKLLEAWADQLRRTKPDLKLSVYEVGAEWILDRLAPPPFPWGERLV